MLTVPIRTGSGLNGREHWRARAARVAREREVTEWVLIATNGYGTKDAWPALPCVCTLTRLGPSNGLDDDNLAGSLKAIRDEVAKWLGVDDRKREVVRYEYRQRREKTWAVTIEFAPMQVPALLAGDPRRLTTCPPK